MTLFKIQSARAFTMFTHGKAKAVSSESESDEYKDSFSSKPLSKLIGYQVTSEKDKKLLRGIFINPSEDS